MNPDGTRPEDDPAVRPDDGTTPDGDTPLDAVPSEASGRVTFGIGAVAVGFLVGVGVLAVAFASTWGADAPGVFLLALWYGFGIGLVTGLPLGIVIGLLLRPVRNQWVHVGVFFAVFLVAALVVAALLSPSTTFGDGLPTAFIIGGAAALARVSVWKLVRVQ